MGKVKAEMGGKSRVGLGRGIERALAALAPILDSYKGHSVVIGGIAVIARGIPRVTRDIDVAFDGSSVTVQRLGAELGRVGIVPRIEDAFSFAAESQVLLMTHAATGIDIDVSLAWLPFELEAMAVAGPAKVGGVMLPIAQPEALVVYKAIAWRPQDQQDVERLLVLYGAQMDVARIRRQVRELGDAMEVNRIDGLEALLRRVL